jgi:hypothetical protein
VWDRYLAYGVALGVAVSTERAIPLGAESDTEAWSNEGGTWRVVRIRYPRFAPPGWGQPPWQLLLKGVVAAAIAGAVAVIAIPALLDAQSDIVEAADDSGDYAALGVSLVVGLLAVGAALVVARGLWMAVLGVLDVGRSSTVDGRVLRVRTKNEKTYIAVDDGTADHIRAWVGAHAAYQGAEVRATVAAHCGYVRSVEIVPRADAHA